MDNGKRDVLKDKGEGIKDQSGEAIRFSEFLILPLCF